MKTAYLDCFSGISGNMLLGALIDAGVPDAVLRDAVSGLGIPGCGLEISRVVENNLAAVRVQVTLREEQPHRNLRDIEQIIRSAALDGQVRKQSLEVFRGLAEAEAAVHGCPVEEVHFHEVGAADAIADIIGVTHCFHHLEIKTVCCSPLPVPRGWVKCAHGELPVPAPASSRLLLGKPVYGVELEQELVTPTGVALVDVLADSYGPMPPMRLERIGYGAGTTRRSDGRPNLLRLLIGESHLPAEAQQVEVIETALDDWNPESWPHVSEQLFLSGALDVILTPVQMKKGRPGFLLQVICAPAHSLSLKQVILGETSAIGLRFHTEQRLTLPREAVTVQTRFGPVRAKKIASPGGTVITPEFEDCRRVALETGVSIQEVYSEVNRCAASSM